MNILKHLNIDQVQAQFGDGFEPPADTIYTPKELGSGDGNVLITLVTFLSNLIGIITVMGGLFFIVFTFLAAFSWITAGGDSGKVEKAREKMFHGVLGLIVMVMSYALIGIVGTIIGIDLINLEETLMKVVPKQ